MAKRAVSISCDESGVCTKAEIIDVIHDKVDHIIDMVQGNGKPGIRRDLDDLIRDVKHLHAVRKDRLAMATAILLIIIQGFVSILTGAFLIRATGKYNDATSKKIQSLHPGMFDDGITSHGLRTHQD